MLSKLSKSLRVLALPVLAVVSACDNPVEHKDDHLEEIVGVEVTNTSGATIATYRNGTWTFAKGSSLHLHKGEGKAIRIFFLAEDGDRFQLPHQGAEHTLRVEIAHPTIAAYAGHGDHGDFSGLAVGETTAKIQVYHGSHPDYETNPGLPIEVVDHAH